MIEDKVWISTILPSVRIGYGAIVGAGSVVTKDWHPLKQAETPNERFLC